MLLTAYVVEGVHVGDVERHDKSAAAGRVSLTVTTT